MVRTQLVRCVFISAALSAAVQGAELNLQQACEEAALNNPGLKSWQYALESARGAVETASTRENPELSLAPGLKHARGGDSVFHLDADLSVPFRAKAKRDAARAAAVGGAGLQQAGLEAFRRQVELEVRKTFTRVLAEQRIAELRGEQVAAANLFLEAAQQRVKSGLASDLETARSEAEVVTARREMRSAEGATASARAALCALLGRPAASEFTAVGSLEVPAADVSATACIGAAMANNANLLLLARQAEVAELQLRATRMEAKPDFAIGPALEYTEEEQVIGIGISRPLMWWDKKTGVILTASAEHRKLLAELDQAKAELAGGVAGAVARYTAARDAAALYTPEFLGRLKAATAQAEAGYTANATPLLVYLDARKTYFDTLGAHYEILADVAETLSDLEMAMGCSIDEINQTGDGK